MIDITTLSKEWLTAKKNKYGKDPGLIESMIYALYLLEQLKLTELDFIFKGGTSLVLIMEQPARFSVDIDVIVSPKITRQELEEYLQKIIESGSFIRMELDEKRSYKGNIPKAHYKFIFKSHVPTKTKEGETVLNPEREILLDILFAENPYPVLVERSIKTEWLVLKGDPIMVMTPCVNSITGDKLTAFAPNTTGVPYYRETVKEDGAVTKTEMFKEIMKQIFDVSSLFNLIDDLDIFRKSYHTNASSEIKYRPERNISSVEQVLRDTIETAIILARKDVQIDAHGKEKFAELNMGINQFGHYVFIGNFRIEDAQLAGARAAYLAAIILVNYEGELKKFDGALPLTNYMITHPEYNFLNKRLKFIAKGEALFYWNETVKLLHP